MEKIIRKKVQWEMGVVAKKFKAEFVVSTGDNFYPNGVRSTRDYNWIASFENIYTAQSLQTDWFVVLGNHDYRGDPQAEIDYSALIADGICQPGIIPKSFLLTMILRREYCLHLLIPRHFYQNPTRVTNFMCRVRILLHKESGWKKHWVKHPPM